MPTFPAYAAVALAIVCPVLGEPLARAQAPDDSWFPPAKASPTAPAATSDEPPTDAEKVIRLQRVIETDRKHLAELQARLRDKDEFAQAQAAFDAVDKSLAGLKAQFAELQGDPERGEELVILEKELRDREKEWKSARERLNLALQERKTLQEAKAALEGKIKQNEEELSKVTGMGAAPEAGEAPAGPEPGPPESQPAPSAAAAQTPAAPKPPAPAAVNPILPLPGLPALGPAAGPKEPGAAEQGAAAPATLLKPEPPSEALLRAQEDARRKEEAARQASARAEELDEKIATLRRSVDAEAKLLDGARRRAENAQEEQNLLNKELQEKLGRKAPEAELVDTIDRIRQAEQREREARDEARAVTDRLRQAQAELAGLEAEQRAARREAERARRDAEASRREVDRLSNPFAPENLVEWAARHLPRVGLILLAIVVLRFLARSVSFRLVRVMARNSGARSTEQDQENRARTLTGIFRSFSSVLIVGGGALLIMDEFGVPVVPLLGGAAVLGLAVAFGAQNLIKDYFSGFMVLLEDQYGINDVVKIGSIAGQVEKITMRVTVLRDLDGVVHFIPHGQITTVSNLTHGWSRACFDIPVAHKEDPDRVMEVLLELAKEMRYDKQFGVLILDEPEMLGVDRFAESAVVIRFLIKTCPLQQWKVKRELLRRIKRRFDELGIEIPFPHRTVYHRHLPEPGAAAGEGEEAARAA